MPTLLVIRIGNLAHGCPIKDYFNSLQLGNPRWGRGGAAAAGRLWLDWLKYNEQGRECVRRDEIRGQATWWRTLDAMKKSSGFIMVVMGNQWRILSRGLA